MNNDYSFENENSENNIPLDFSKNNPQNLDVEIDFSSPESPSDSSTEVSEDEKNVDNPQKVINNQNPLNNGKNLNNRQNFQPNYYSYQQGYQQNYNPPFNQGFYQVPVDPKIIQLGFEKKAVKRSSNHIGLSLILFYAFQIVFSVILGKFIVTEEAYRFISDPAINLELNILITLIGFVASAFFIFRTERSKADKLISYGMPKKGTFAASVMLGIGFCYVANITVSMLQSKFEGILPFVQTEIELPEGILGFILSVISVAVAPALLEELLFRGAIMGNLLKFGKGFAIFTSAFLFALVHGNLVQIPFAFLVGLVLGVMVLETNSIWTGVAIHFTNNFISVCLDYSSKYVPEDLLNIIYLFILALFIILGILGVYFLSLRNKNIFSYKKTMHISTDTQKFGWFSSSPSMIIYFIIIFLEVLSVQMSSSITL